MIACDLLSIDKSIPPDAVSLSCSLLDGHIGRGKAVVKYAFKPSAIETKRTQHFSIATKFFSSKGECLAESEYCNVLLVTKTGDKTREYPCCIDSIPEAGSSNSAAILLKSSYSNSTYGDLVFRVEAQPGLTLLQFQLEFLLRLRGRFPTSSGDVWTTRCCSQWHQSTAVEYSLTCRLSHWMQARVDHADYASGVCTWSRTRGSEPMSLSYTKKQGECSSLNFDIVCSTPSAKTVPCMLAYEESQEGARKFLLGVITPPVLTPSWDADSHDTCPGEFVFLVDCSGSMSGMNMLETVKSVHIALKSLPIGSYFNVIAFGSRFRHVFPVSAEYSEENLEKAFHFVSQMDTTLGGTNLLGPLQWLRKQPLQPGLSRQIFIITDGESSMPGDIVALMRPQASTTSCHLFGIGNTVSSLLLSQLAALTGGTVRIVEDLVELSAIIVDALHCTISSQVVCDVSVSLQLEGWKVLETYQQAIPLKATGGSVHYFILEPPTDGHGLSGVVEGHVKLVGRVQQDPVTVTLPLSASLTTHEEVTAILPHIVGWRKLEKVLCIAHRKDWMLVVACSKDVGLRSCYAEFVSTHTECPVTPVQSVLVRKCRVSTQETVRSSLPHRKRPVVHSSYSIPGMVKAKMSSWFGSAVAMASTILGMASSDSEEDEGELEYSLDDLESQQQATKGLHWGDRGELVLPNYYYYKTPPAASHPNDSALDSGSTSDQELEQVQEPTTSDSSRRKILQPRDYVLLLRLQHHHGAWSLNDALFNSLGFEPCDVPLEKLRKILTKVCSKANRDMAIATLIAINAFHCLFYNSERVWRLSVGKSYRWLHKHGMSMDQREYSECTRVLKRLYHDSKS